MNILLIHQNFAGKNEAGGTRHWEIGEYLAASGDHLTVITSPVSYLTGEKSADSRTSPEQEPPIDVRNVRVFASLHRSFVTRIVNFLSFTVASFAKAVRIRGIDVVWATSPPLPQVLGSWAVARVRRVPWVFEVRDLWPSFAIEAGVLRNPVLIWLSGRLERFLYRASDRIVVNSPGFIPYFEDLGVPAGKVTLVANGSDVRAFDPDDRGAEVRKQLRLEDRFIVCYAGAFGQANDLGTVLRAAGHLRTESGIVFLLVGDGKERAHLAAEAQRLGLSNVYFVEAKPKSEIPSYLAAADVCLAILADLPMFTTTYPNKVFDYMAAGRPTILAINGVIRDAVESASAGTYVRPEDDRALAKAVRMYWDDRQLLREHGQSARAAVVQKFSRDAQATAFRTVLGELTERDDDVGMSGFRPIKLRARLAAKRGLDVFLAAALLMALSPLLLMAGLVVRLTMGSPVLFRQERLGWRGRAFTIMKFRTMVDEASEDGSRSDEERLTPTGRFLRRLSIDELPELINVLRGEMSLVGPRPLLAEYEQHYSEAQRRRHEMPPGLTGPTVVSGRNLLSWEEKFELDLWYVDNWSLRLDCRLLAKTLRSVFDGKGITAEGHATMPRFDVKDVSERPPKNHEPPN
jgi:lipopolysaccharide/colanic/teichoic acid biosynthesis glycosyltransferase/glycosyltransferase involved in cell wall biosynthesis